MFLIHRLRLGDVQFYVFVCNDGESFTGGRDVDQFFPLGEIGLGKERGIIDCIGGGVVYVYYFGVLDADPVQVNYDPEGELDILNGAGDGE
ncbi:MAG: hypothetical protein EZS28_004848 [Streblomastix strix]|uniref:Uncharacterized protein n=1 Tax=Streblomastix strix TaxID=222440 RepID=A0A5J4WXN7_9EUKA|nr:MAG: hypothetical protein EZS28_004848 [Streblomastix strix]